MTLDIVTKGLPFLHMAIVTAMVLAGVPRIFPIQHCSGAHVPSCQFLSLRKSSTWNFPPYGDTDICLAWEFAL